MNRKLAALVGLGFVVSVLSGVGANLGTKQYRAYQECRSTVEMAQDENALVVDFFDQAQDCMEADDEAAFSFFACPEAKSALERDLRKVQAVVNLPLLGDAFNTLTIGQARTANQSNLNTVGTASIGNTDLCNPPAPQAQAANWQNTISDVTVHDNGVSNCLYWHYTNPPTCAEWGIAKEFGK